MLILSPWERSPVFIGQAAVVRFTRIDRGETHVDIVAPKRKIQIAFGTGEVLGRLSADVPYHTEIDVGPDLRLSVEAPSYFDGARAVKLGIITPRSVGVWFGGMARNRLPRSVYKALLDALTSSNHVCDVHSVAQSA